jgi:mannose-1-phosphate guanylyltransferase
MNEHLYAVILAGGGGTRLWPLSRQKHPKHLLQLIGKETILQSTYKRVRKSFPPEKIFIITHKNHLEEAKRQLPEMQKKNWLVEPQAKNTAMAMTVAATYIAKLDPEAVVINLPADHIIKDITKYSKAAFNALQVAANTKTIVAIGIKPTFAHTGLGYMRIGQQLDDTPAFIGRGFKEKPDLATAQAFLISGEYLWNGGIYSWAVKTLFEELSLHAPELKKASDQLLKVIGKSTEKKVMEKLYEKVENIAIDVAVSEKAKNLAIVPGDFDWSDVGDWRVVYDISAKDEQENVVMGNKDQAVLHETKDTFISAQDKLVVAIGLENLVIIDTEDALLICHKDKTQDVKKAVEKLKALKKDKYL